MYKFDSNCDDYEIVPHYIIFTANNFRVLENKSDGIRPLGVQVLWSADLVNNKMTHSIEFSHPLDPNYSGKAISERTMDEINKLGSAFKKDFSRLPKLAAGYFKNSQIQCAD